MAIVLIILGSIGWIADVNQWFVVPPILYKGSLIAGIIYFVLSIIVNLTIQKKLFK